MGIDRYLPTVAIAFKFVSANRRQYLLQVLGDLFQVSVLYFIWTAAYTQAPRFGGLDRQQMITYLFAAQLFRILTSQGTVEGQIASWVRSGDLVRELVVPLVTLWKDFAFALGWLLAVGSFSGLPLLLMGILLFGVQPPHLGALPALALSLLLALAVSFGLSFFVGTLAFWTDGSLWGISQARAVILSFAGGALIPLALFPDWLQALARALPFQAAVHIPTAIYLGQIQGAQLWRALGIQALWAAGLMAAANWFFHYSLRKVTIPGG